ncbi:translation initiation factor IF-2 [Serratia marcescens]|nr:translation initiation factor IF-2 [Serratia marcescens]
MPGIIQSFDAGAVTATIQPAVKASVRQSDGALSSVALPLLVDVPVVFPRGGGVTLTVPVTAGDECLVVFADRCIDYWWQNGGVQEPVDQRQHHLADAFALVGPQSQAKKISGISTSTAQFRSDDGSTFLEIDPATKKMKIVAPGGLEVITPQADFSEAVTIKGLLSWMGGMVGSIASGTAAKITGMVEFVGGVFANCKRIDDKHKHGGVERGGGQTDEVS